MLHLVGGRGACGGLGGAALVSHAGAFGGEEIQGPERPATRRSVSAAPWLSRQHIASRRLFFLALDGLQLAHQVHPLA